MLPLIMPSQAQKHVTYNEALDLIDRIIQLAVLDDAGEPPASPQTGDLHIVGSAAARQPGTGRAGKAASRPGMARPGNISGRAKYGGHGLFPPRS